MSNIGQTIYDDSAAFGRFQTKVGSIFLIIIGIILIIIGIHIVHHL